MLGVFAEFETNLRRDRQMEGIARAKANGAYAGKGRPASIEAARVREMSSQGLGPSLMRGGSGALLFHTVIRAALAQMPSQSVAPTLMV